MRLLSVFGLLLMCDVFAADYPQFRGAAGNGVVESADVPLNWSQKQNLAWSTKLPGTGWSQPVVVGKSIFVTAAVSDQLLKPKDMMAGVKDRQSMPLPGNTPKAPDIKIDWQLMAVDAETGKLRWAKTVVSGKPKYPIHPSNTYATETPCADAERVYAYFGATGTVAAFDHSGKEEWKQELGAYPYSNGFGSGSSPVLFEGRLYISCFNEEKSFLIALDARTGHEVWRQSRETAGSAWASPFVWRTKSRSEIVACGYKLVTSHDPETGKELWRLGGIDTAFAPSPAADGEILLLAASSPFSSSPIYAIKAGAQGDITLKKDEQSSASVAWFRKNSGVGMASPCATGGYLYIPGQAGLICVDTSTGIEKYKERLPKSRTVAACPVVIGDKLLVIDEAGQANWVKTGPAFELLGSGKIEDTIWSSPAVVGDSLYLRGVEGLYCIKKQ